MPFYIEVDGLEEAIRKVQSIVSAVEAKDVEKVLLEGAKIVQGEAKRRAPYRTGKLRRSIKAKIGKRRSKMVAGAFAAVDFKVAPHAYLVEYGTSRMRARPYFRPAWEATKDEVRRVVEEGLRKLIGGALR